MAIQNICYKQIKDDYYYGMYSDFKVIMMISCGYINSTKLCSDGNKYMANWRQTQHAQELIDECKKMIPLSEKIKEPLIIIDHGDNDLRGTYIHPLLVPHVASWVSAKFGMVVSKIVNNYMIHEVDIKMKEIEKKMQHAEYDKETLYQLLDRKEEDLHNLQIQLQQIKENENEEIHHFQQQIEQIKNEKQTIIHQLQYIRQYATVSLPDTRKQHQFAVAAVNSPEFKYYVIRTQNGHFNDAMEKLKKKYPHLTILLTLDYTPNGFDLYNKMKQTMGEHISFRGNYFNSDFSEADLVTYINTLKKYEYMYAVCKVKF